MLDSSLAHLVPDDAPRTADAIRLLTHELRQPLSCMEAITFYLDLIVPSDDLRVRQQIDKLRGLVDQMSTSIEDVVHLSQIAPSQPEVLDLNAIIEEATQESPRVCPTRCELHLSDRTPRVRMDSAQLRHLIGSLVAFFQCYGEDRGVTHVHTYCGGAGITLRIRREGGPETPSGRLTLASARRIVEAHDGTMRFDSDPGKISVVTIRLPKADTPAHELN